MTSEPIRIQVTSFATSPHVIETISSRPNRPTICIDRAGLCVNGVSSCLIKIQWNYKCGWPWCDTWEAFPAKTVLGKYVQGECGDRDGQWRADYVVSYSGNQGSLWTLTA